MAALPYSGAGVLLSRYSETEGRSSLSRGKDISFLVVITFTARWAFVPVPDDESTNVRNSGYGGGCNVSCAVLIGDMIKGRPGGLMNETVSWNTLVTWDSGDGDSKSQVLQGTGRHVWIMRTTRLLAQGGVQARTAS